MRVVWPPSCISNRQMLPSSHFAPIKPFGPPAVVGREGAGAVSEVAVELAHEIRNSLASLELFVGLLEEQPARTAEWVGHLRAGLRGLGGTVDNVLLFGGAGCPPLRPVRLGAVVADATEFVRPVVEQAGLLLLVAGVEQPGMVMGNETGLRQIVLNMVMNAVRHTPAYGMITISLREAGGSRLRLAVTDTGCGIAPEQLGHIFEAGWSGSGDRSGLGLAVCARIAAQHGGVVRVRSEVGHGSTFELEVPLV